MPLDEETIQRELRAADGFAADGRPRAALTRLRGVERRLRELQEQEDLPWIRGALVRVEQSRRALEPALEAWRASVREREGRYRARELTAIGAPSGRAESA